MSMKLTKLFIIFALMAAPVYAVECTQSQALNDLLNGTKTVCDPAETAQKLEAKRDKAEMIIQRSKNAGPLWTDEEINKTARDYVNNHGYGEGGSMLFVMPIYLTPNY